MTRGKTMSDFITQLEAKGFRTFGMGGNLHALVRQQKNADGELITDVITDMEGASLPEANDWLFCSYRGDWMKDADCPMKDNGDSEQSPVTLLELLNL